ncbi:MAG TPA: hypothetical protein VIK52_10345 [Opitutaceae bacterium]
MKPTGEIAGGVPNGKRKVARPLVVALVVGIGGHIAALALIRVELDAKPVPIRQSGYVSIVQGTSHTGNLVVSEQLEYLNPEPLFMPTEWNAGVQPLPAELRRQPDQAFQSFDPQMTFSSNRLDPVFTPPNVAPEEPLRALDMGGSPRFATIGRIESTPVSLEREAFIEVRRVGDGGLVHTGPLSGLPATIREVPWAPIRFLIAVNEVGLVGSPMVEVGSGNTEVDAAIQGFLGSEYRLGNRLIPGFYRVTVGP